MVAGLNVSKHFQQWPFLARLFRVKSGGFDQVVKNCMKVLDDSLHEKGLQHVKKWTVLQ